MLLLFVFFWDTCGSKVGVFNIVPEVSEVVLIYFILFFLLFSFLASFIFSILPSTSLIISSASVILLLVASRVLLISVIALSITDWFFFISSAKSLQLCPTLCDPIDGSPPGSPVPGILQARILEWVAISFSNAWKWKVKGKSLSHVRLLVTPWIAAYQAPPSMGFARLEYWSGVSLPSPYFF